MRIRIITSILLIAMLSGCASTSKQDTIVQTIVKNEENIALFVTQATKLVLHESKITQEEKTKIQEYLVAVKTLFSNLEKPNFDLARVIIDNHLADKHKVVGLAIVNVVERYAQFLSIDLNEDQEQIRKLVLSLIDASLLGFKS